MACLNSLCPGTKTSFQVALYFQVQQANGLYSLPPLALSLVEKELGKVAQIGGVQGDIQIFKASGVNPVVDPLDPDTYPQYGVLITFPLFVPGYKYPLATCPSQQKTLIDVSSIQYACPEFAANLAVLLAADTGATYIAIADGLDLFLGADLLYLHFTVPVSACLE